MRIRRIAANSFRCIKTAEVELGRGLNVLYAPNDHGKSTLALALRAALLLPPASTDGASFSSWFDGDAPSVQIVFEDDEEKIWRLAKTFGGAGKAELDFSKDGTTFTRDCSARQVEEKLRTILSWGIPAPGGKAGPRGFPTSFLSQVLLAEQTSVAQVLASTLEDDPDESGRVRLTKALKGLAQDPLFKRVLERAQVECDSYFTATGQKKRGKASPFTKAADETRRFAELLTEKERKLQDAQAAETEAYRLAEQLAELLTDREALRERGRALREANDRHHRVDAARQLAEQARATVERMQSDRARIEAKAAEVEQLRVAVEAQEIETNRLIEKNAEAADAMRQAEEAHRQATSRNAARQRELRQAQLERTLAELTASMRLVDERRDCATAALAAQQALEQAEQSCRAGTERLAAITTTRANLAQARAVEQQALLRADEVVTFARWQAAANAAESARRHRQDAAELREQARRLHTQAAESRAPASSASLPNVEQLTALLDLQRRTDLAEAALGGGLSLMVESRTSLPMRILADGVEVPDVTSSNATEVEATRTIEIAINDLLDLKVVAGDANSRREAARLRTEWTQRVSPVLALAKVATVAELQQMVAARDAALAEADHSDRKCRELELRAAEAESRAADLEVLGREAAVREQALIGHERAAAQQEFVRLGSSEAVAERKQQICRRTLEEAANELAEINTKVAAAEADVRNLAEQQQRAVEARDLSLAALSGEAPAIVLANAERTADDLHSQSEAAATELRALGEQRDARVARAEQQRAEAAAAIETAQAAETDARNLLVEARNAFSRGEGELAVMRERANEADLSGACQILEAREAEIAAIAASGSMATDEEVADIERVLREHDARVDNLRQLLNQAEGALRQVGGTALRDEIADLREARERSEARHRDLEMQAEAWQLLRSTLRESEEAEGAHLGRALAAPVAKRFADLTANRYGALSLGPALTAQGVSVSGAAAAGDSVLDVLSVGTREQLATLLRLAIAEQLRSAIVLDDHLVQTDGTRLAWFRQTLRSAATTTQVIILTCHPEDYISREDLPVASGPAFRDIAAGTVRAIDLGRTICRCEPAAL